MMISSQTLRAMGDELTKLAAAPEERLTPSRKEQMLRDAPIVIGSMGLGWGLGKTVGDAVAKRAIKDPATLSKVRKYGPAALALTGTGIGLALSQQRRRLKQRRDQAEREAKKETGGRKPT